MRFSRASKAQLGAANTPDAHTAAAAFASDPGRDTTRDEVAAGGVGPDVASVARRGYRLGGLSGMVANARPTATDVSTDPGAHVGGGQADARHETGGSALPRNAEHTLIPERLVDVPDAPVHSLPVAPPDRARAGWTGADPTRPSRQAVAHFSRPFDKLIADHPMAVTKIEAPAPRAARPITFADALPNALPSAGGSAPAGRMAAFGAQLNTFRLVPRPWDEYLVNTGGKAATGDNDPAAVASSLQRGRQYRL